MNRQEKEKLHRSMNEPNKGDVYMRKELFWMVVLAVLLLMPAAFAENAFRPFAAEVVMQDAPLYTSPSHEKIKARFARGTLLSIGGENGEDYYVESTYMKGYIPKTAVGVTEATKALNPGRDDFGIKTEKRRVYTGGKPLGISRASSLFCEMCPSVVEDGATVRVVKYLGDWAQLDMGRFIETRFLDPEGDHTLRYATVKTTSHLDRLNLRWDPDRNADASVKLCSGTRVQVIGGTDEWTTVLVTGEKGGNSFYGCVMNQYLVFDDTPVENAGIRVCLQKDLFGNYANTIFGVDKPYSRFTGELLAAGTEMTVIGVSAHYTDEFGDSFLCLLDDGRMVSLHDAASDLWPLEGTGIQAKTNTAVKLRREAAKKADALMTLSEGTKVDVLLRGEGWTMVQYKEQVGYVMSRHLKFP